ncbi:mdtC domain protein [Yersinia ruckeri]
MYQSHGALIIKLPAKYISKLLQKLRSPEKHDAIDMQIGKLLTVYETSYMAIKSSRLPRKGRK